MEPIAVSATRYLLLETISPPTICAQGSSLISLPSWTTDEPWPRGGISTLIAPEIDLRGGIKAMTILSLVLLILESRRK